MCPPPVGNHEGRPYINLLFSVIANRGKVPYQHQQLTLINHASQIFSSTLELDEVIQIILGEMHRLFNVLATSYWLRVPETGELLCKQASGPHSDRVVGWRLARGQGLTGQAAESGQALIVADLWQEKDHVREVDLHTGLPLRAMLTIPLRAKGEVIGVLNLADSQPGRFSMDDILMLEPIAAVAASAIQNAQLFNETQRQRKVAESLQQVAAILNNSLDQDVVVTKILEQLRNVIQYDSAGLFLVDGDDLLLTGGAYLDKKHLGYRIPLNSKVRAAEVLRSKKPMITPDVREDPHWESEPTSGLILSWMAAPLLSGDEAIGVLTLDSFKLGIYSEENMRVLQAFASHAAIAIQNARLFNQAQQQRQIVETALAKLKATQNQLVMQEKMASLGMLTAGIAHEIKNPLNFVTSFAQLSIELAAELRQVVAQQPFSAAAQAEIDALLTQLQANCVSINEEGQRANSIVQSMLLHSRGSSRNERQPTDLNALLQEAVNLAFHGLRAKNINFNLAIETHYDPAVPLLPVVPQNLSRVFVNLINNAYYATSEKYTQVGSPYQAKLVITTQNLADAVEIAIKDNGIGIPAAELDKLFTPFFTTKPGGQGTGLGLSISYDIMVQEHHGSITVQSKVGQYTEFVLRLPKSTPAGNDYVGETIIC